MTLTIEKINTGTTINAATIAMVSCTAKKPVFRTTRPKFIRM